MGSASEFISSLDDYSVLTSSCSDPTTGPRSRIHRHSLDRLLHPRPPSHRYRSPPPDRKRYRSSLSPSCPLERQDSPTRRRLLGLVWSRCRFHRRWDPRWNHLTVERRGSDERKEERALRGSHGVLSIRRLDWTTFHQLPPRLHLLRSQLCLGPWTRLCPGFPREHQRDEGKDRREPHPTRRRTRRRNPRHWNPKSIDPPPGINLYERNYLHLVDDSYLCRLVDRHADWDPPIPHETQHLASEWIPHDPHLVPSHRCRFRRPHTRLVRSLRAIDQEGREAVRDGWEDR